MKPAAFAYRRAASVDDALALLAADPENTTLIAGGQSLGPLLNLRLARPTTLVDISGLDALAYIHYDAAELRIGALTRHAQVEHYPGVLTGFEVVREACRSIGYPPIRENGTVGGSIAYAAPTAELCLVSTLLDAVLTLAGPDGLREVGINDFVIGPFMTSIAEGELLVEVRFPRPYARSALFKAGAVALATAFDVEDGRIAGSRFAAFGLAPTAVRLRGLERALDGLELAAAASPDRASLQKALLTIPQGPRDRHLFDVAAELACRCVAAAATTRDWS